MESVHRRLGDLDDCPWYRQIWPWILIALPASAVIASLTTVWIAVHNRDSLVVDDYYKQGLAINRVLDRDYRAATLGLAAQGGITAANGEVTLVLSAQHADARTLPPVLRLVFYHPTLARHDRVALLQRDPASGAYQGNLQAREPGAAAGGQVPVLPAQQVHWDVVLAPAVQQAPWRLTGRLVWPGQARFELKPAGDGVASSRRNQP